MCVSSDGVMVVIVVSEVVIEVDGEGSRGGGVGVVDEAEVGSTCTAKLSYLFFNISATSLNLGIVNQHVLNSQLPDTP